MKHKLYCMSISGAHPPVAIRRDPLKRRAIRWLMSWFCDEETR